LAASSAWATIVTEARQTAATAAKKFLLFRVMVFMTFSLGSECSIVGSHVERIGAVLLSTS
jgi:hypothetical protein